MAWAYRSGREFDLATSVLDSTGMWSEPVFFGLHDGVDQVQPALAVDSSGNTYLAMTVRPSSSIYVTVLPAGSSAWTPPTIVSLQGERASMPTLRIVADRLVLAYRVRAEIVIRDLPVYSSTQGSAISDGPDILPPTGESDTEDGGTDVDPFSGRN